MTELDRLPLIDSGHVVKRHAMQWLDGLNERSDAELKDAVVPKPADFSGSKYPTAISTVRITGAPEFVEAAGSFLKPLLRVPEEGVFTYEQPLQLLYPPRISVSFPRTPLFVVTSTLISQLRSGILALQGGEDVNPTEIRGAVRTPEELLSGSVECVALLVGNSEFHDGGPTHPHSSNTSLRYHSF